MVLLLQVLLSLVIAASVMPLVLLTMPAARDDRVGLGLLGAVLVVAFVLLRFIWPRRAS